MKNTTQELLTKFADDRLERVLEKDLTDECEAVAYEEAMGAVDRKLEYEKLKSGKRDKVIKVIEIAGMVVIVPIMDYLFKRSFAREAMTFERTDSFTTTAGRSISGFFKWKR